MPDAPAPRRRRDSAGGRAGVSAKRGETPRFFRTPAELRGWLRVHHADTPVLWVGFHKKASGRGGVTYPEALDEALCFGWIDGVRKSVDATSYKIRFTPRKPHSVWSSVNIRRAHELTALGRMRRPGRAAFARREARRSELYGYERRAPALGDAEERVFKADRRAWEFFEAQPPYYRRVAAAWAMSAKREETRRRRLAALIRHSAAGERLPQLVGKPARA